MDGEDLVSIVDEVPQMMNYLVGIAEEMFMRVTIFHALKISMPISIEELDPVAPDCPIRYRMHYHWNPPSEQAAR